MEKCVAVWKAVKAENEALHVNFYSIVLILIT